MAKNKRAAHDAAPETGTPAGVQGPLALVTGLNGTLAPVLARALQAQGWRVRAWSRAQVPPEDAGRAAAFVDEVQPDAVFHLAMGDAGWAGRLAAQAHARGIPFVFTSTAMVFHHAPDGPHRPDDWRSGQDGYGQGKIACEDAIRGVSSSAVIARIGWQIDREATGNNMVNTLDQWQAAAGRVEASRLWRPACSFMDDTVQALIAVAARREGGLVHLDSNAAEAWRFDQIAQVLAGSFTPPRWQVQAVDGYAHDQRLVDGRVAMPPLSLRLPGLRALA